MMETKTSAEVRDLEWEYDTRLLQDQIVQLRPDDPYRKLLQDDLRRRFVERYGNSPIVTGGGGAFNSKTGASTHVVISTSAGLRRPSGGVK